MVNDGVIEPVSEPSPWISALLVVKKPREKVRICIDPKPLISHYQMFAIDDVLSRLTNAKVFITIDVKNGF